MLDRAKATVFHVWTAWRRALPFHLFFAALIGGAFFLMGPQEQGALAPGQVFAIVALALVCTMGSWVYAGQSARQDFTPALGLRRAPSLLWRGLVIAMLGIVAFGTPLFQNTVRSATQDYQALGIGFTVLVGLMAGGAFVLLEWSRRVGDAPTIIVPASKQPGEVARAAGRVWWHDVRAGWSMIRHVWRNLPKALFAMIVTLSLTSLILHLTGIVFGPLLELLPPAFAMLLALPIFALCPTAAAVILARGARTTTPPLSSALPDVAPTLDKA